MSQRALEIVELRGCFFEDAERALVLKGSGADETRCVRGNERDQRAGGDDEEDARERQAPWRGGCSGGAIGHIHGRGPMQS